MPRITDQCRATELEPLAVDIRSTTEAHIVRLPIPSDDG